MTTRALVLSISAVLAACGDPDGEVTGDGGSGSGSGSSSLAITTSNGSPASAPVFTATRPNVKSELTLTVKNTGSATSGAIALALAREMEIRTDLGKTTCVDATLAAQATCDVVVTLTSFSKGTYTTDLTITAGASELGVSLAGEVLLPDVTVTPASYNFGTVPMGTTHTFTLRNNDSVAFNGLINVNGPLATATDCVLPIAPAASCAIMLSVDTTGAFSGSLSIGLDQTTNLDVPITGTGT